ncbi:MAG: helix-turn-helix domain-containing protein [Trebonia sp.]
MGTVPQGPGDSSVQQASPTLARLMLGKALRRLREAADVSREAAGHGIRGSESKISRLELGRTGFKTRDVDDLCTLYGVTDQVERGTLLDMAQAANSNEWWHSYRDVIPGWFEPYLGLEQAASVIRSYEPLFVPGLLQTPDYARTVIKSGYGSSPTLEIERRVELRMRRQRILLSPQPAHLWTLIDEGALHRPVGGRGTMSAQLRHLLAACDLSHVTLQVMSFRRGGYAAGGAFTVVRLPDTELPDAAYLEHLGAAIYPDKPADLDYYRHWMNLLTIQAEEASATPEILHRLLSET